MSRYPNVSDLPIDLYPFDKKVKLVTLAQKRNEKEFIKNHKIYDKIGF